MFTGPTQVDKDYCIRAKQLVSEVMSEVNERIVPAGEKAFYFSFIATSLHAILTGALPHSEIGPPVTPNPVTHEDTYEMERVLARVWHLMFQRIKEFQRSVFNDVEFCKAERAYFMQKFLQEFEKPSRDAVEQVWAKQAPYRQW